MYNTMLFPKYHAYTRRKSRRHVYSNFQRPKVSTVVIEERKMEEEYSARPQVVGGYRAKDTNESWLGTASCAFRL